MVDDAGNIINESDVDYEIEEVTDEFGNKQIKKRPYLKRDKFNERLQSPERKITDDHYVVKPAIEIDEFGNKKVLPKLVPDDD